MDSFLSDLLDPSNALGHLGYALIILSMMMRHMLHLRLLALMAGIVAFIYYGFVRLDHVSAMWEVIFTLVNAMQLYLLWYENRASQFTEDEKVFVHDALMDLKPLHAARLMSKAALERIAEGDRLLEQGETPPRLYFILDGQVEIRQNGVRVGSCGRGDFLGEMSLISRGGANATAVASTDCRAFVFDRQELLKTIAKVEPVRHALYAGIQRNLLSKINRMNAFSADIGRSAGAPAIETV